MLNRDFNTPPFKAFFRMGVSQGKFEWGAFENHIKGGGIVRWMEGHILGVLVLVYRQNDNSRGQKADMKKDSQNYLLRILVKCFTY